MYAQNDMTDEEHADYLREAQQREEELDRAYRSSLYCMHGRYVGDWAGPDYICIDCEMA